MRFKTLAIAGITFIGLMLAVNAFSTSIIMENFEDLEHREMVEDITLIANNIESDLSSMKATTQDWAMWDDAFFFASGENPDFIAQNMGKDTLEYLGMDMMLFFDRNGSLIFGETYLPGSDENIGAADEVLENLGADGYIMQGALSGRVVAGPMSLGDEMILACAHPILPSSGEGDVNGVLLNGKFFDEEELAALSQQSNVPVRLFSVMDPALISSLGIDGLQELNHSLYLGVVTDEDTMMGYGEMADIYGSMTVVLQGELSRDVYLQGKQSQEIFLLTMTCSILIFAFVTIGLLETWVISRVSRLGRDVSNIAQSGDTARRVAVDGSDEIGQLASDINGMMEALDHSQRELVQIERESRDMLERQVMERTNELMASNRALAQEVTERTRTEEQLRHSERLYRAVVEDQMELIVRSRPDHTITFANQAYARYYGTEPWRLLNTHFRPAMPAEDVELVQKHLHWISATKPVISYQHRVTMSDGSERWQHWTSRGIFDGEGRLVEIQSVGRDMTDKVKLEQEVLRTQKLESLGRLAGGIAHDFNNILTSMMGNIALARADRDLAPATSRRLMDAENSISKAKSLTKQLLTFSEGGNPVKERTKLQELVRGSADLCVRGTNVQSELDTAEDLWDVEADRGQLRQVVHNIMDNSVEAMPDGGKVSISARNWCNKGDNGLPLPAGNYVMIRFVDQGLGISKENLDRIFDPFFSTKGGGSGLGLTAAMSIVRKHGGHIAVESELGKGTDLRVYLPAINETAPEAEPKGMGAENPRVLLMDDEVSILEVVTALLSMLGYAVDCARDGQEALEMFRRAKEQGEPFDLVIMDLTIPGGMGGKEAIRRLREAHPEARAIVSSGYSNDPVMSDFRSFGFVGVLQKPYTLQELKAAMASALAADPSAS